MLGSAVIVFREVLEAALIIGLMMAVTRGVPQRIRFMAIGMTVGLGGAVLLAVLGDWIAPLAEGMGQELLNAIILLAAIVMLTWHLVWMKRHAKDITQQIRHMGTRIESGESDISIIAVIIGLAILREGSEVVLFMFGLSAAGSSVTSLVSGGLLGLLVQTLVGVVLYLGLVRVPLAKLFSISSVLILLLTAGLAAQASNYLVQLDILPALGNQLWDTSGFLSQQSLVGQLLHIIIGYMDRPMGIQVLVYALTLIVISMMMYLATNSLTRRNQQIITTGLVSIVVVATLFIGSHSRFIA